MRKLKLQVQISVDGFIAGPKGEMDWMAMNWGNDILSYVSELTDSIDTILLGRKLAEGFIPHWAKVAEGSSNAFDKVMNDTPKFVFSKTRKSADWKNTQLINGDLVNEVTKIKNQKGNDCIVYGGGTFVSSLIRAELIDEFYLFVNPTVLGKGMTIFEGLPSKQNLSWKNAHSFDCGITVLHYELKKG